ncbi:MAG: hypothetical protein IKS90_03980 [Clostridia bacterium]|nr:hypothetical protein [Clostridia bacterium]
MSLLTYCYQRSMKIDKPCNSQYRYALIGDPVEHSLSPTVYAPMFKAAGISGHSFDLIRVKRSEISNIRGIVLERGLAGFAITMPHKKAIIPYLDELDDSAVTAKSVNIVSVDGDKLIGFNTDAPGLVKALLDECVSLSGKRAVILGTGAVAVAAGSALNAQGANVKFINRAHTDCGTLPIENAIFDCENVDNSVSEADILINATTLGMENAEDFIDLGFLSLLNNECMVFDLVYRRDGDTSLVRASNALGLKTLSGIDLLYHQALIAFRIWTGFDIQTAYRKEETMNIGLVQYEFKNNDIAFNLSQIERAMDAARGKADMIVFGESFLQGFDALNGEYERDICIAVSQNDEIINSICALSESKGVDLVFGYFERDGASIYSSCAVVIGGRLTKNYRRISPGWKDVHFDKNYKEGETTCGFVYRGREFMLALCGDMWDVPERFKSDGVLIWPVYVNYSKADWLEAEFDYANQSLLAANKTLFVNSLSAAPESIGGTFCFENGVITKRLEYATEDILIVEI